MGEGIAYKLKRDAENCGVGCAEKNDAIHSASCVYSRSVDNTHDRFLCNLRAVARKSSMLDSLAIALETSSKTAQYAGN